MKNHFFRVLFTSLVLLFHLTGRGEDIDLFVGTPPSATDVPNVLIILDNTANWNTAFVNEKAALVSLFNALPVDKFRVGLMMFTETGSGNSGDDGAYVRAAIRLMNSGNKIIYANLINSLDQTADKSNGGKIGKSMEEAYLYFSGGTPHAGNAKVKTDYSGNIAGTASSLAVYSLSNNALDSKAAVTYNSPVLPGCAKNYIIYISNGAAQDNNADITQATTALSTAGGSTTTIPLNPSGSQDNVADEWARYLKKSALNASVYTVDVNKVTTGQGPGWTALLKSTASVSSGKYFDVSSTGSEIVDALNTIFSEIQSVNSVFASVSLPVSVNTQGTYLNQVYVGMFRPDKDAFPRWAGNLKQYKLGAVSGSVRLQDAADASAINNQTGFIAECARSYWTPTAVDTEWAFRPQGDCLTVANSQASNFPDGNVVDKGAQAYKLRGTATRTVKTCSVVMASCTTLTTFNNTNVTQAMLGASSSTERDELINWAIGQDIDDENIDSLTTTQRRMSAHGDVVHSRPVAINFGTDVAPQVVAFYGGNDGMLRAVNGNRTDLIGTIAAGGELWAFMPPEFYGQIKRLRDNTIPVSYPTSAAGSLPKPYGLDGPITSFQGLVGGSNKAFIYASMRRGGRSIYSFDVTNSVSAPTSPTLKWKIGCPNAGNDTDCTTGMSGIGQTWSAPKSLAVAGYGAGAAPLLIFGGGYDTCDDTEALSAGGANHNCTGTSKGHYVYVIDADTGAVVRAFDTGATRGVIADATIVRDAAGLAIYAYTADLGGNVYRINFSGASAAAWSMTKIASLGCDTTAPCTANRKFMFAPSVVAVDGNYVVMLGSGDREKPLTHYAATTAVTNNFFMFTDKPAVASAVWPGVADCGSAIICRASLLGIVGSSNPSAADLAAKKGWYLGLTATEQVVTSAITIFGVVTFSTHQPAVPVIGSCSANLGNSRVYNMGFTNASPTKGDLRYADLAGDGLPPSPVGGIVKLDDGSMVPFCIGCDPDSPLQGSTPPAAGLGSQPKGRLYWFLQR